MFMKQVLSAFILIILLNACNSGDTGPKNSSSGTSPASNVKNISYSIINTYAHDSGSFTQGLTFYKGELYEGTGEKKHSRLMKKDLTTGKSLKEISLGDDYFGEGIAIVNDTVYQLTWQEHVVFVYDLKTFKKIGEFRINTEGWGITYDGKNLVVSDGSSNLYFYDPATFRLQRTQAVYENQQLSFNLNELEYIDGFIYANQWQYPYLLKIDPSNGQVVAKADLSDLWKRILAEDPDADVPNGIAYDDTTGKIYITGKRWPKLFEVKFSN